MPLPLSKERLAEIANQSFVTEENQASFGVEDKEDVAQTGYQGIVTSDEANSTADSADETLNNITVDNTGEGEGVEVSFYKSLFERISSLQGELTTSIENEKIAQDTLADNEAGTALDSLSSSSEGTAGGAADLGADANASNLILQQSIADTGIANLNILKTQMSTLSQYRSQFNEYTQQDIDSIARTAERSTMRQLEENDRVTRAMQFAGVVGGRAQFAPVVEQSIINDVVQEGLDRIEVINEKKNTAIREARKAEADFNIDVFEQQAELAKEYNNEIESTISDMNAQVRQAELDERDRIDFRQQQEERSSIILAGELIDATPDEIAKAAVANGIDYALLSKAVNDAKFEQSQRAFEGESNVLTLAQKRANLNKTRLENQKTEEDDVDGGFDETDSALLRQAGLEGATNDEKIAFLNLTKTEQNKLIATAQEEITEFEDKSINDVISDVVGENTMFSLGGTDDKIKAVASAFGINPTGWKNKTEANNFLKTIVQNIKTTYPEITDTEIKDYLKDIPEDATAEEITAYLQFARAGI